MSEKKISSPNSISEFKNTSKKYVLRKREEFEASVEMDLFFGGKPLLYNHPAQGKDEEDGN